MYHTTETYNGSNWVNVAWLFNYSTAQYETVYSYSYSSNASEQQTGWPGSWGPLVETSQNNIQNINTLGFSTTLFLTKNSNYQWGLFELLSSSQSDMRDGNKGLNVLFLFPNHTFAVD